MPEQAPWRFQKITKPMFIIQGFNDPRVPMTEAEQMLKVVRDEVFPHFRNLNGGTTFGEYMADAQLMVPT